MKSRFSINLDDGRIIHRNEEVDKQVNYYPLPDEVTAAIVAKKVSVREVITACQEKIASNEKFEFTDFLKKIELLNVRRVKMPTEKKEVLAEEKAIEDPRAGDMISLGSLIKPKESKNDVETASEVKETKKKNTSLNF